MARATYASFNQKGNFISRLGELVRALAILVSGKNPDATDFTIPHVAATATAVATGTADAQGVAAATGLRLLGYSVRESAGTPAVAAVTLRNGEADTAAIIAVDELAANEGKQRWFGPNGVACPLGIFVERVSGESEIVIYHTTIT